ncbi:hypothetical protein [Peribacillus sp. R9-11]|uniref:hypothetical protein n=1 Tax=Peribacillus sp. R9-11 TaxID=3073271 RepID=UPI002868D1E0|nr:hypothetical protein [Peribacillus sp. R9-11]WMX58541.1 hypothetical protein RE409_28935 [Peribacillus sp. R9-11]
MLNCPVIQLDSKEVEEAIIEYLKNEGFKDVSFKFQSTNVLGLPYPISASIERYRLTNNYITVWLDTLEDIQ